MDRRVDEGDADEVFLHEFREERHDLRLLGAAWSAEVVRVDPDQNWSRAESGHGRLGGINGRRRSRKEKQEEDEAGGGNQRHEHLSGALEVHGQAEEDRGGEGQAVAAIDVAADLVADEKKLAARPEGEEEQTGKGFPHQGKNEDCGHVENPHVFKIHPQDGPPQRAAGAVAVNIGESDADAGQRQKGGQKTPFPGQETLHGIPGSPFMSDMAVLLS